MGAVVVGICFSFFLYKVYVNTPPGCELVNGLTAEVPSLCFVDLNKFNIFTCCLLCLNTMAPSSSRRKSVRINSEPELSTDAVPPSDLPSKSLESEQMELKKSSALPSLPAKSPLKPSLKKKGSVEAAATGLGAEEELETVLKGFESDSDSQDEDFNSSDEGAEGEDSSDEEQQAGAPIDPISQSELPPVPKKVEKSSKSVCIFYSSAHVYACLCASLGQGRSHLPRSATKRIRRRATRSLSLSIRQNQPPSGISKQKDGCIQTLRLCGIHAQISSRHRGRNYGQLFATWSSAQM